MKSKKLLLTMCCLTAIVTSSWADGAIDKLRSNGISNSTNLLVNPGAENGFDGWTVENDGSGWSVCDTVANTGTKSWVASYYSCTMSQRVNLLDNDFTEAQLDAGELTIYAGFSAASFNYEHSGYVSLDLIYFGANEDTIRVDIIHNNTLINRDLGWTPYLSLKNINGVVGIRSIEYKLSSTDSLFWNGNFAPYLDDFILKVEPMPTSINTYSDDKVAAFILGDMLHIEGVASDDLPVKLFSLTGSLVFQTQGRNINVSTLPKGVYIVETSGKRTKVIKR